MAFDTTNRRAVLCTPLVGPHKTQVQNSTLTAAPGTTFEARQFKVNELYGGDASSHINVSSRLNFDSTEIGNGIKFFMEVTATDRTTPSTVLHIQNDQARDVFKIDGNGDVTVGNATEPGNFYVYGDETIVGDTIFEGATQIGNAATDTLDIQADITSNLIPSVGTETIGSATDEWGAIFLGDGANTFNVGADQDVTAGWNDAGSRFDFDVAGEFEITTTGVLDIDSTGAITVDTAAVATGTAAISLTTGAAATSGNTGGFTVSTGDAGGGNSGSITLDVGSASATSGVIAFQNNGSTVADIDMENLLFDYRTGGGVDTSWMFVLPDTSDAAVGQLGAIMVNAGGSLMWHNGATWQTAGTAAGNTLQQAYDAGSTITTDATGNITFTLALAGDDFEVMSSGAGDWFRVTGNAGTELAIDATVQTFDVNAAGAVTLDGVGASNLTTDTGALTVSTTTSGSLILDGVALVDINAGANLDIDVTGTYDMLATSTFTVAGTGASSVTADTGNLTLATTTSGNVTVNSVATVDVNGVSMDFDTTTGGYTFNTADQTTAVSGGFTFLSGNTVGAFASGSYSATTGNATTLAGTSGTVTLASGTTGGSGATGAASITTGAATGTGDTGDITLTTGAAANGTPGDIILNLGVDTTTGNEPQIDLQYNGTAFASFNSSTENMTFGTGADTTWNLLLPDNNTGVAGTLGALCFDVTNDAPYIRDSSGWVELTTGGSATLQSAYVAGNSISTTNAEGNITFNLDEAGDDFEVMSATAGDWFRLTGDAGANLAVDATVSTFDVNASGAITIDGVGASNLTTDTGNLTLSTTTSGTLAVTAVAALDMDGTTVTLDGTNGVSIDGSGAASNLSSTSQNLTVSTITSGTLALTGVALVDIDAGANLDIDVTGSYDMLSTGVFAIAGTGASSVTADTGNLILATTTSGNVTVNSVAVVDVNGVSMDFDTTTGGHTFNSANQAAAVTGGFAFASGATTGAFASGSFVVATGTSSDTLGSTGPVTLASGNAALAGGSGALSLTSGTTVTGTAGNVSLTAGAASGAGTGGSVVLTAGTGGTTDGDISLIADGSTVLFVDGSAQQIVTGEGADALWNFVLPDNPVGTAPTVAGAIMFDATANSLYYANNTPAWVQVATGGTTTLQSAYDNGNTITTDATGNITFNLDLAGDDFEVMSSGAGDWFRVTGNAGTELAVDATVQTFDVNAAGAVTLDGVGASNLTTDTGNLTVSTTTSGDVILAPAGQITIADDIEMSWGTGGDMDMNWNTAVGANGALELEDNSYTTPSGFMIGSWKIQVYANAYANLLAGDAVYLLYDSVTDNRLEVQKASADSTTGEFLGFALAAAVAGAAVYVIVEGMDIPCLRTDVAAWATTDLGTPVYLSTTDGELTIDPSGLTTDEFETRVGFVYADQKIVLRSFEPKGIL